MALTVVSIHWQTDARLRRLPADKAVKIMTPYGHLVSMVSPLCDYTETEQQMLCLTLDEANCTAVSDKIRSKGIDALNISKICIYFGFCGFLSLEIFTRWDSSCEEIKEQWTAVRNDIRSIVEWFSWNTALIGTWLSAAKDFLSFNSNYSWGIHNRLQSTMVRHKLADATEENDSYIFFYQTATADPEEAKRLRSVVDEGMHEVGSLEGSRCWQNLGYHLWLTPTEPDENLLHRLATSTLIAAYTILTYDVSVMNYKNMLRLLTEQIPFDTAYIRDAINIRDLDIQELELVALRDLKAEKTHLTKHCLEEYGADAHRQLFLNSQQSLRLAADAIDSGQQSSSSHSIEVVISILTIMSVYSLVADCYSLLTQESPHTPFSLVSTSLVALTTVFCLVTIFVLFRRRKNRL